MYTRIAFAVPGCLFILLLSHGSFAQSATGIAVGNLYVPTVPDTGQRSPLPTEETGRPAETGNTRIGTAGVSEAGGTRVLTVGTFTLDTIPAEPVDTSMVAGSAGGGQGTAAAYRATRANWPRATSTETGAPNGQAPYRDRIPQTGTR